MRREVRGKASFSTVYTLSLILILEGRALPTPLSVQIESAVRSGRSVDWDAQNQGAVSSLYDTLTSGCSLEIGGDLLIFLKTL